METRVKELTRDAESAAREIVGLPKVGEGWVSETALFYSLKAHFSQTVVVQHGQPHWLGRQHFDIWFPDWNIAVEYHGAQHFEPIDFFGGDAAYRDTVERDERKKKLAEKYGVILIVVTEADDDKSLIVQIEKLRNIPANIIPPPAPR
jgi:hypothetical protein